MSTIAQDNLVKALNFDVKKVPYPLDTSGNNDFNQGDMLQFDTSNHYVKAVVAGASVNFAGVALKSANLSLYVNQNKGTAVKNYDIEALVAVSGIFSFKTTASETYNDGTALYIGADAQTVTTVSTTNTLVGYAKLRPGGSAVTGAAGVSIDVLIAIAYPVAGI